MSAPPTIDALAEAAAALEAARPAMPVVDVLADSFPEQRAFIEDPARLKYAFCTRRAAKSFSGGLYAFKVALQHKRCAVLIIGLHRKNVKGIWWLPILKTIADRFFPPGTIKFNESDLTVTFPNGSIIYLIGLDASKNEQRKALGRKTPLVLIDEAQDFQSDLESLVYHTFRPATIDYSGTICLMGTPGLIAKGFFYRVTTGGEPGWSAHEWTAAENTAIPYDDPDGFRVCDRFAADIEELKQNKPGIEQTPAYRRNYLKEWIVEDESLVYRYTPAKNSYGVLPSYDRGNWHRILSIDLGFNDATAFTVLAYHDHDPNLYVEDAYKKSKMDVTDVATRITHYLKRGLGQGYEFDRLVVDPASKQVVEELRNRYGFALYAAEKTDKAGHIELMNGDFMTGRILLHAKAEGLAEEYLSLIWDPEDKHGKRTEHAACENHLADAALYGWRYAYNYLSEKLKTDPPAGSVEYARAQEQRLWESRLKQLKNAREAEEDFWGGLV